MRYEFTTSGATSNISGFGLDVSLANFGSAAEDYANVSVEERHRLARILRVAAAQELRKVVAFLEETDEGA